MQIKQLKAEDIWSTPAMQLRVFSCSAKCSSLVNTLTFPHAILTSDSNPKGKAPFGAREF